MAFANGLYDYSPCLSAPPLPPLFLYLFPAIHVDRQEIRLSWDPGLRAVTVAAQFRGCICVSAKRVLDCIVQYLFVVVAYYECTPEQGVGCKWYQVTQHEDSSFA